MPGGKQRPGHAPNRFKKTKQKHAQSQQTPPPPRTVPSYLLSDLGDLVQKRPQLPPGRNYIQLNWEDDVIVVTAYLARISQKIICILPEQEKFGFNSRILDEMTNLEVLYPDENKGADSLEESIESFEDAGYPTVLLLARSMCSYDILNSAGADCIVHWGLRDIPDFATQIPLTRFMRSCIVLLPGEEIDVVTSTQMTDYGITEYSDDNLYAFLRREIVDEMPGPVAPPKKSKSRPKPPKAQATPSVPSGHYYVVLEDAAEAEIISLITHIALGSKKTICCLPMDRNIEPYRKLIEEATNLKTVTCGIFKRSSVIKQSIKQFKSEGCRILLRPAEKMWIAFLTKSLTESLIFWGVPPSIVEYLEECSLKVSHSCLILTMEQHREILSQRAPEGLPLEEHPFLQQIHRNPQSSP